MTKPTITDLPERYQAQIRAQLAGVAHPRTVTVEHATELPPARKLGKPRIRQNSAGLNKTEQAFSDWLRSNLTMTMVALPQAITLKLANGVRYTPDFFTIEAYNGCHRLKAYETKGYMRDDASVKLKVAATLYPWIRFHLVTKRSGGAWQIDPVLP
jgi:hypothetical protein